MHWGMSQSPSSCALVGGQIQENRDSVGSSRQTKSFEAKAKSPIGGGGDAEGTGQMKSQQMCVDMEGCVKKKQSRRRVPLSLSLSKKKRRVISSLPCRVS